LAFVTFPLLSKQRGRDQQQRLSDGAHARR
jgi:hypothetical protein